MAKTWYISNKVVKIYCSGNHLFRVAHQNPQHRNSFYYLEQTRILTELLSKFSLGNTALSSTGYKLFRIGIIILN